MYTGAIPIVEHAAGFDRTLHRLPILQVRSFSSLSPSFLERVYPLFADHAEDFDWSRLLQGHWLRLLESVKERGDLEAIRAAHPPSPAGVWLVLGGVEFLWPFSKVVII